MARKHLSRIHMLSVAPRPSGGSHEKNHLVYNERNATKYLPRLSSIVASLALVTLKSRKNLPIILWSSISSSKSFLTQKNKK